MTPADVVTSLGQVVAALASATDDVERLAAWVHRVATTRPELLPAALAQLARRTAPRLTLRAYRPRAGETLALTALAQDVEVDVDSLVEDDDGPPPEAAT